LLLLPAHLIALTNSMPACYHLSPSYGVDPLFFLRFGRIALFVATACRDTIIFKMAAGGLFPRDARPFFRPRSGYESSLFPYLRWHDDRTCSCCENHLRHFGRRFAYDFPFSCGEGGAGLAFLRVTPADFYPPSRGRGSHSARVYRLAQTVSLFVAISLYFIYLDGTCLALTQCGPNVPRFVPSSLPSPLFLDWLFFPLP